MIYVRVYVNRKIFFMYRDLFIRIFIFIKKKQIDKFVENIYTKINF